jgi:MinD-like ATPase involved in chromosome partitioning or flagellar assembly
MACPHCNGEIDVFKRGGGKNLAEELVLPYLGSIPLDAEVAIRSDSGEPVVLSRPDSAAAKAFLALAENCHKFLNPEESLKAS